MLLPTIYIPVYSLYISRILSAWFYRCHTPNDDCFNVRAYFKSIRAGLIPKVTYAEYIEMPEYSNIQSRMLGADSFPYRNVTVDDEVSGIPLLLNTQYIVHVYMNVLM